MEILKTLIALDIQEGRRWFAKERLWRIVVAILFLMVIAFVSISIGGMSRYYFTYLRTFEEFGELTIDYVLRASVLVVFWIGTLSSLVSGLAFLLTPNKKIDQILTTPTSPFIVSLLHTIKAMAGNLLIFIPLLFPVLFSYFNQEFVSLGDIIFRITLSVILLVVITEAIGASFAYIIASQIKKKIGLLVILISASVFLAKTVLIYKVIFPEAIQHLSTVSSADFTAIYQNLPLVKYCYLGHTFLQSLTGSFSDTLALLFFALGFLSLSLLIQQKLFLNIWQQAKLPLALPKTHLLKKSVSNIDLFSKDILSIIRSPKEMGYLIFLFLLLVSFVGLFTRGVAARNIHPRFVTSTLIFSWFWFIFYSGAYLLRLVFPLMSKEGRLRWWLFTLPISKTDLILTKIKAAFIISIPLYLIGLIEWFTVPIAQSIHSLVSVFIATFVLAASLTLIGMIKPDYSLSDDPEKTSTSLAGIIALTFVVVVGVIVSQIIRYTIEKSQMLDISITILLFGGILLLVYLYHLAKKSLENFKFDRF